MLYQQTHNELKKLAKEYLSSQGFTEDQIFDEYPILVGTKTLVVDIVAVNEKRSIAIECGQTLAERLPTLKYFFTEVIHIPYGTMILTEERLNFNKEKTLFEMEKSKFIAECEKKVKEANYEALLYYRKMCVSCKARHKQPRILKRKRAW